MKQHTANRRRAVALAVLFVAVHAVLSVLLLYRDSLTSDEPIHMTAGYLAARDLDLRINREHPPLAKMMAGFGLATGGFSFPYESESYERRVQYDLSLEFLYGQGNDVRSMAVRARWPFVLLSVGFSFFLFFLVRHVYGDREALIALFLYALSPTVLAHNHLVTTDLAAAVFCFAGVSLSVVAFCRRSLAWSTVAGLAMALAALSKYSALLVLPFSAAVGVALVALSPGHRGRTLLCVAWALLLPVLALAVTCGICGANTPGGSGPLWTYLDGLSTVQEHLARGHDRPQFLLGACSFQGWWYYFPLAFFLKTSLFFQILLVVSIASAAAGRSSEQDRLRSVLLHVCWLFPVCYTILCMSGRLNIGFRHLLPVMPFLFVFMGVNTGRLYNTHGRALRVVLVLLFSAYGLSTLSRYPRYMGFFTEWASGHPEQYLGDSNLDWGQDLGRLAAFVDRHGIEHIRLDYFGPRPAPAVYLGDRYERWSRDRGLPVEGWLAVSEFNIMESRCYRRMGVIPRDYGALEEREPVARVGSSIRVYRFP